MGLSSPPLPQPRAPRSPEPARPPPLPAPRATAHPRPSAPPAAPPPTIVRLNLSAPPAISAGQEFVVSVSLETALLMRSGLLDIAFDPSRLKFLRAETGPLVKD